MKLMRASFLLKFCSVFCILLFANVTFLYAADGKKWDGKKYPFTLLDSTKPNSESNPFIIDSAGKLAYFGELSKCELDMETLGKSGPLKGLHFAFKDNYVKLTTDLDMNGSQFEFPSITGTSVNFDGGGHVIDNLRISDKSTPANIQSDMGVAEITLALFADAESIKNLGIGKRSTVTYYGVSKLTLMVFAAGLAANVYRMDNCYSDATVNIKGNGEAVIGGLTNECAYLSNCHFGGSIIFEGNVINSKSKNLGRANPSQSFLSIAGVSNYVGSPAIVGQKGLFSACYNTGSITVKASAEDMQIGGVCASTETLGSAFYNASNLYNLGNIQVSASGNIRYASIGGVIGKNIPYPGIVNLRTSGYVDAGILYNKGNINVNILTGQDICVGGVGGGAFSAHNSLSGLSAEFGGIFGFINTYNIGSVSVSASGKANLFVGGVAGNGVMVINSYNTGKVSASSGTGGTLSLGGLGGGMVYVQNSYNIGSVSAKGSGTNAVGGILGTADAAWGEADRVWNSALNAFWLKQNGGINSDLKYAEGERYGYVYSFDSASASIMKRSDNELNRMQDLNGTLLFNLNEMVEDKIDRQYRRWIIDGTNGAYPVLSSVPTIYSKTSPKPDSTTAALIAGTYTAVNKNWNDTITLTADGSFKRTTGGDGGTWSFDGKRLILRWTKWTPEILSQIATDSFSCKAYKFTLIKSSAANIGSTTIETTAQVSSNTSTSTTTITQVGTGTITGLPLGQYDAVAGSYLAEHKDWTDTITLFADGTFKRDNGETGTFTFKGTKLVLVWANKTTITLYGNITVFVAPSVRFKMTKR